MGRRRRSAPWCWALASCVLVLASPRTSLADDEVPPPPALVAPRVLGEVTPDYPAGETRDARVLLEVVVETDGAPGELRVLEGVEPFVTPARAAARRYRFAPGRRGDVAIRARVRLLFTFTAPPPRAPPPLEPTPGPAPAPAAPAVAPADARVEDVTVTGVRSKTTSPTEHRMGRAEVRIVPGAFGDAFRAIDILPGIVPTISGLPYYYVRGAPPSTVGYFVDEVRVPYVFHFALGPSVIQPALIDEVALHPAAFPGRYGRYAGAIVAGKTRAPASELRGEAQVRVFDAGAWVETPFADGRGSVGVGGRYSYSAALFSLVAPKTSIDYRDFNARASYELGGGWRASALTFGSYDLASQVRSFEDGIDREVVFFASEFYRLDMRLDRQGADGSVSRIAATLGFDRSRVEGSRFAQDAIVGVRARHGVPLSASVDVEAGVDTMVDRYSGDLPSPFAVTPTQYEGALAFFSPRVETATGAWASASWHPTRGFDLTGTARADVFTSDGAVALGPSPRVSMRVPVSRRVTFLGALGIGAQPPAFAIPIPAVGYRRLPGGLGYGYQKSAGFEAQLPLDATARVVGFHHSYFNLRDIARDTGDLDFQEPQPVPNSPAQAYGVELFVSRKLSGRVGGFASYTFSRSEIGSGPGEIARVSPFDRTHVFQIGASVDLGRSWRASTRFLTYTGWPDLGPSPRAVLPRGRLPAFVRLDARVEKRWRWRKAGYLSFVIEALNTTASKEIIKRECTGDLCSDEAIGPVVVPSVGLEGAL